MTEPNPGKTTGVIARSPAETFVNVLKRTGSLGTVTHSQNI